MNSDDKKTHFGYEQVPLTQKTQLVADVFSRVADNYDLMNDMMSLGIHRLWKKIAIDMTAVRKGQVLLDLAGGTGDLTWGLAQRMGGDGRIVLADINNAMLQRGRARLTDKGLVANIHYVQADAECLPFADNYFDRIMMAFGLRNVTDKDAALRSMYRVLKPGGRCIILEFSTPANTTFKKIYDAYSFSFLPFLGRVISNDKSSYQYLAESIRMHPDQQTLKSMMENAGFEKCEFNNLTGGIVAVHKGFKFEC